MTTVATFSADVLRLDAAAEAERIQISIRDIVAHKLRRRGVVVGLSGGIDSSVVAALATRALGADRVLGLLMPEADSSPESRELAEELARTLGIRTIVEDIAPILQAAGCYTRRDEAIRLVVPEFGDGYRCKIVLPDLVNEDRYSLFTLVVESPSGEQQRVRLPLDSYLGIVAATNHKQRVRKMMEYYYADRLRYAVAGTPNRLEHDLGFFVKHGDGSADLKPIAHLYKTQVFQLAEHLDVPAAIRSRRPTTDTYSLEQSQEEFYFGMSLERTDLCLYARYHGIPAAAAAEGLGMTAEQVERAFRVLDAKREASRYLHMPPLAVDDVEAQP